MPKQFPLIEVSGSYTDVGTAIGYAMKSQIQSEINRRRREINDYSSLLDKTKPYFEITYKLFPQYIQEMTAIAKAADVPANEYFFINNQEVYDETDRCTIAVSFSQGGAIVGHNEDANGEADEMYILRATIGEKSFFGLNYASGIPGCAASINNFGLVQCINWLNQETQVGVPKFFLARAILECRNLSEAESLIRKTPRASGFNHVLVHNQQVRNIEIAGEKISVEETDQSYVHTNHYLSNEMKEYETFHTKSSEARYQRASKLVKPNMVSTEMMRLLSDREDQRYPISREGETVGSLVFDTTKNTVSVCYGPANIGGYVSYQI